MLDRYLSGATVTPRIRDREEPVPLPTMPQVQYPSANEFLPSRQVPDRMRFEAEQQMPASEAPGILQTVQDAIQTEWLGAWALRAMEMPEFNPDPSFSLTNLSEAEQEEIFGGLSTEDIETFGSRFAEATSFAHAKAIRRQLDELKQIEQRLAEAGAGGVAARIGAAILDPVAIGATALTEGAAAPVIWSARISRLQRAVRAGLLAGGVNAGIEGLIASQDPFRDLNDVAVAGAAGMVVGGTIGAIFGKSPGQIEMDRAIAHHAQQLADEITVEQGIEEGLGATAGNVPRQVVTSVDDEGNIVREEIEAAASQEVTAGGSAGAMLNPVTEDFLSMQTRDKFRLAQERRPVAEDVKLQFDMYSQAARSAHPMVAYTADLLSPNPSGVRTTGRAQDATAWEISTNVFNTQMTQVNRAFNKAFDTWMKENGGSWFSRYVKRDEFAKLVGRTVRDPNYTADASVRQAADAIRNVNRQLLDMAKRAGVRGFSEVPESASYLMRVHSLQRWTELRQRFGDATIDLLLTRAIMAASPGLDFDKAGALARAYKRTVDRSGWNVDMGSSTMFSSDQREWLREILTKELQDAGESITDDQIEDILYITQRDNQGRASRAKRRLGLDETFRMKVVDPKTGQETSIGIQDFLEDHAEVIMQTYVRQMGGLIGMARKGFKGANDFDNWVNDIRKTGAQVQGMSPQKLEEQIAILETMKRGVTGQPLTDLNKFASMRRVGRALRDYNFARVMGQVGFAQIAEIGTLLGQMGFRASLKHMPALRKLFRRMQNGELDDQLSRELEAMVAPGTDRILQNPLGRFDDMDIPEMRTANRIDKFLNVGTRIVADASFMHPINMALERMAARAAVQRFADMANGVGRKLSKQRLLSLGLDEEMANRVFEQMRKHVGYTNGPLTGRKVSTLNLDTWDDTLARDAFTFALQRWMRRAIQKNDIGDLPQFMTTDVGKIIFQFRSFMMVSWAKQAIHGVRMHDFETFATFIGSMLFGALGYGLLTSVNAVGRPDADEYLEERLNPTQLATAAFYRAGWASLLPMGIDTGTMVAGVDPIFAHARVTQMSTDFLFGNPTFDLIDSGSKALRGMAASAVNPEYQYSQQDYRALQRTLMFQNVTGIRNALQFLGDTADLPRFSKAE